jgi:hypothetical protein
MNPLRNKITIYHNASKLFFVHFAIYKIASSYYYSLVCSLEYII